MIVYEEINIHGGSINEKPKSGMSGMICAGATIF